MLVGYARTSPTGPSALAAQVAMLEAAGCDQIFKETGSLSAAKRLPLSRALRALGEGDSLVVTEPHRLAASLTELTTIAAAVEAKGAFLRVLSIGLDTSKPGSKRTLKLLGVLAESERVVRHERQAEGIRKAHARGQRFGRPPLSANKISEVLALHAEGLSVPAIVRETGVSRASVFRMLRAKPSAQGNGAGAPVA